MSNASEMASLRNEIGKGLSVASAVRSVHADLVSATPVDKGDARSNWIVKADTPEFATRPAFSPLPALHSKVRTARANRFAESANRAASIADGLLRAARIQPLRPAFITSSLDYVGKLDAVSGYTLQQTPGWINRAIVSGLASAADEF